MVNEPIAVVGRGCALPGALDPDRLWENVLAGEVSLAPVPEGRWRLPARWALGSPDDSADRTWSDIGGYVPDLPDGSLAWVRESLGVAATDLDAVFRWTLRGVGAALREAGQERPLPRAGLVMGNLLYPTTGLAVYAEHVWRRAKGSAGREPHPYNRFSSGLPAHLAARAFGLGQGGMALDAACASSLYAVALACDRLRDGRADLMVAGGVNGTDDLFLHVGFCTLTAMSRSGRSRPFQRDADGLVPAQGAAFVALMRLTDALAAYIPVLGVIRGVGLSNDGRGQGLLVPSEEGQRRAMEQAYRAAGVEPGSVGLIECHATGTAVGDTTEVRSTAQVFADAVDIPVGSVKSNLGHTVTAAGAAGLLKVLGALRAGVRPPTAGLDEPLPELEGTPLRPLREAEEWAGPRRAAVSAFGFGGNNAHLIVDAWTGDDVGAVALPTPASAPQERIAVVAVGARVADGAGAHDLLRSLLSGESRPRRRDTVEVALDGLRFPPLDLHDIQAQQLLVLEAAREAADATRLPRERTMALVGMGCDPEAARLRVPEWFGTADAIRTAALRDAIRPVQTATAVIGAMPNVVANRINSQLDLRGPGFAVSAEEASGVAALEIGARALRVGEADAVLVGAVDLSDEPVHRSALAGVDRATEPGDAAVVLVLKRLTDARADEDTVLAVLDEDGAEPVGTAPGDGAPTLGSAVGDGGLQGSLTVGDGGAFDPSELFGRAHAASGLLSVAAAALALRHRARLRAGGPAVPALESAPVATAICAPLGGSPTRIRLRAGDAAPFADEPLPRLRVYSGRDRADVLTALAEGRESAEGPARLVLCAADADEHAVQAGQARRWLLGQGLRPSGAAFHERPVQGEIAFVYSGGSMAYAGMGRELMLAFPGQLDRVRERSGDLQPLVGWAFDGNGTRHPHPLEQVGGTSVLGQLHTRITHDLLGLRPHAALGYSTGESVALASLGAWRNVSLLFTGARNSSLFTNGVVGDLEVPRRAWLRQGTTDSEWASHLVEATPERVRAALADEPTVHLMVVNAPDSCVFGGSAQACERVLKRLADVPTLPISYRVAAHVPEVEEVRQEWRDLHHLPTEPVPGVRFYTCCSGDWYHPTSDSAADTLTDQGIGAIDFARTVERAWEDGVRIFVEHGPRAQCSGWIDRTLGTRDHLALALDAPEGHRIRRLFHAVAELMAAGVPVDADALYHALGDVSRERPSARQSLTLPAHPPEIRFPEPVPAGTDEVTSGSGREGGPEALSSAREPYGLEAASAAPEPVGAVMAPAPDLAAPLADMTVPALPASPVPPAYTVLTETPSVPVGPAVVGSPRVKSPVPATAPETAPDAVAVAVAHNARVAEAHRLFLGAQARTHAYFLASRQRAAEMAVRALAGGQTAATPLPHRVALSTATATAPAAPQSAPPAPTALPSPVPGTESLHPNGPAGPTGPSFTRGELERLATGPVSELFGPLFAPQDAYLRQTRMPAPPMLLADRVTGIDAEPGSMGTGTVWTETDIPLDAWYLDPAGRIPPGIMIEAGQADLLLISWLGVDLLNKGERVYRLLGCELTFHGSPPGPGETLRYEIHIDGHGEHGGVRLFFFHYDAYVGDELRLSMREGQAGYFTDQELAETSGILWNPQDSPPDPALPLDPPAVPGPARSFTAEQVRRFVEGRPADCFGPGWELTRSHIRTPRTGDGRLRMLHSVPEFDPTGGPWGRGHLRAQMPLSPDDWFFEGHFPNDPCMPGTLMFEGCLQAMSFYLAAAGFTVERDGWRFEPVADVPYPMFCRGQVTPDSRLLTYEVFVSELSAGPEVTLVADVLCTVDGVKAFHARGVGLRLVPD
ncbi:beta-ketoacyl synthase N-terminal-like domain-containing protein [Streptomyces sp. NPDC002540]